MNYCSGNRSHRSYRASVRGAKHSQKRRKNTKGKPNKGNVRTISAYRCTAVVPTNHVKEVCWEWESKDLFSEQRWRHPKTRESGREGAHKETRHKL